MDNKNKSALSTRWAQMSKQEQIIERKKMEIQAKLEAQKQAAAMAAQVKLNNSASKDEKTSTNIFSNDGSFMSQYKALLEKQKQEMEEKERQVKLEEDKVTATLPDTFPEPPLNQEDHKEHSNHDHNDRRRSGDKGNRRRWNDRGKNLTNSPTMSSMEDMNKSDNIPPLMQIPFMQQHDPAPDHDWQANKDRNSNGGSESEQSMAYPDTNVGHGRMMRPGPNMGPGPMGPGQNMGPRHMGPSPTMGPGPNMGQRPPMGPGMNMGPGPMMGPGGQNMPPMPPGGPMPQGGPMPPFMGGPPNFPMPPNWGPNGPGGPCGPGPMPPNMCGPGPNGPMPPFFGPPFPNPSMMRPNGPPNMMPPNSINNGNMPFMGRPPFGPNGPNFGNGNGPPNMPFIPPNSMPPNLMPPNNMPPSSMGPNNMPPSSISIHNMPPKPLDSTTDQRKLQNIPPPIPLLSHVPAPKDMEPNPAQKNQVLSADPPPPSVHRAAMEVARNGDHWENVLTGIQDQNMWFLQHTNSNEYKKFRELVNKMRQENPAKPEVKPEDKYEPEFCLEDDYDSDDNSKNDDKKFSFGDTDSQKPWNQFNLGSSVKREETSSQSDEDSESKRERRKRKKSRWGDEPPVADIKPPGIVAPLPPGMPPMPPMPVMPGVKLAKIEDDGLKLTNVSRANPALMQYAMTNYGTTNLSPEDWKKCEDNFKLNLLFQDMLKKRQEVERLAASGKHKYEYDSDEDTAEGTWEHKLRAREMYATEKWADELTKQAAGKHHIGDFLPPEELKKFMEKYSAVKSGKEPDLSDYKEFKLKEDNVGFKMLQKLGWSEGQGLGAEGTGIVDPINKANQPVANMGLGASSSDVVSPDDDEFDAYRKRMMLAYRFRPNPLNNPRRPYY